MDAYELTPEEQQYVDILSEFMHAVEYFADPDDDDELARARSTINKNMLLVKELVARASRARDRIHSLRSQGIHRRTRTPARMRHYAREFRCMGTGASASAQRPHPIASTPQASARIATACATAA
jgi:hypothetical protein